MIWVILVIALILFLVLRFFWKHRLPPVSCVTLVTGGVKSGKSSFAVWYCVLEHFIRWLSAHIYNFFHKKKREIPCLYSNIPLKYFGYRKLTRELLLRQERFYYGSVVYINEASLLADSMMFKDEELNEVLMLFNKLYGHETYGGLLMYDTQSLADCHFAIKRCISEYVHLDGKRRALFGLLINYRRMKMTTAQESMDVNVFDGKEDERPEVFIPSLVWKIFDAYCFSILTDDLPISDIKPVVDSLKSGEILTFSDKRFKAENKRARKRAKQKEEEKKDVKKMLRL